MFRQIVEGLYASPQIALADVEQARALGVTLIRFLAPRSRRRPALPGLAMSPFR
jgi:protein tyrosine phosphatase (PTP) superfamily phosphohydrolase (DUF442 family)